MYLRKPLYFMVIQDQMMIFSEKYIGKIKINLVLYFEWKCDYATENYTLVGRLRYQKENLCVLINKQNILGKENVKS